MRPPDKWLTGWDAFLKRKTRGLSRVDLKLIRQLQVEYIGMIQNDAKNEKVERPPDIADPNAKESDE